MKIPIRKTFGQLKIGSAGFTMVELLLTSLLISIFTVGVVATWDLSQPSVQTSMLRVAQDMRYAQSRSMITGVPHGFRTLNGTQYEIYKGAPGNPASDPSTRMPMVVDLASRVPGTNFQGNYVVQFDQFGFPTLGGGSNVVLSHGNASRTLTVASTTGMIQEP